MFWGLSSTSGVMDAPSPSGIVADAEMVKPVCVILVQQRVLVL